MNIRVLLVEDHRMVREALRHVLSQETGIDVIGEAGSAREALDLSKSLVPDVIVLDIGLPDLNGIEVAARLRLAKNSARIIALSARTDRRFVIEMLRVGASGYVPKAAAASELVRAVMAVANGQSYLSAEVTEALVSQVNGEITASGAGTLGRREREVLRLVAEGKRTTAIAEQLNIAQTTVEVHRRNIMRKLELRSVAELTKHAIREGITAC
jgi:two-component system NarL family response regulator